MEKKMHQIALDYNAIYSQLQRDAKKHGVFFDVLSEAGPGGGCHEVRFVGFEEDLEGLVFRYAQDAEDFAFYCGLIEPLKK